MKKIKIDFMEGTIHYLEADLEYAGDNYLDLETGCVVNPEHDDIDEDEIEENDRYMYLEPIGPQMAYEIMKDFISTVDSDKIRGELYNAIDGPKPFRNFKESLYKHKDYADKYEEYKDMRLLEILKDTLAQFGYEIEE